MQRAVLCLELEVNLVQHKCDLSLMVSKYIFKYHHKEVRFPWLALEKLVT